MNNPVILRQTGIKDMAEALGSFRMARFSQQYGLGADDSIRQNAKLCRGRITMEDFERWQENKKASA